MTTYTPVSPEFLAEVEAVIGKENVFTDPEKLDMYKTDEEYDPRRFRVPEAVVRPGTPEEIAAIVKLCNKYMVPSPCAAVVLALPMALSPCVVASSF